MALTSGTDSLAVGNIAPVGDGAVSSLRGGRLNDLIVTELNPQNYEQTARGNSYCLGLRTTTGVSAGNINAAAAAASTQFALWNPVGSGVNLALKRFMCGIISGTIVGGPMSHNQFGGALPTIASVGTTAFNNLFGGGLAAYGGKARFVAHVSGTVLTGGSALIEVKPSTVTFSAGSFAALGGSIAYEDLWGDIVIPPGGGWVPCFAAAGTSVLAVMGVSWTEIPV